jgi:ketosteroid isomerase-like protein
MSRRLSMVTLALLLLVTPAAWAEPEEEIRAVFGRFVAAQNAHDLGALRDLLWDSTRFLWITHGMPVWGREAALKRFEAVYQGTWRLEPTLAELHVTMLSNGAGQLYVPILFTSGTAGQPAQSVRVLMNQTIVRTPAGWKVANIVPVPILVQAASARPPIVAIGR